MATPESLLSSLPDMREIIDRIERHGRTYQAGELEAVAGDYDAARLSYHRAVAMLMDAQRLQALAEAEAATCIELVKRHYADGRDIPNPHCSIR
jgi:hypothetical protein